MLETTELRWFCSGTLPEVTQYWFQQDCPGEYLPPEEREDLYLSTAGCEHLGIKLRQGKLEVKWRAAELGILRCSDAAEGEVEKWIKLTSAGSTSESIIPDILAKGPWIRAWKARSQRKYQVLPDQSLVAVPVSQSTDQGCTLELTTLSVNNHLWWSLAFEAFGQADSLFNTLQAVVNWVLKTYRGPKLRLQDSYAYPKWLSLVA